VGLTNAAGTLVERYTYSAYGTLGIYAANGTVRSSSTYANRYTYTGREWDAELKLYHFRARWYDPATGGFVSRDPLGYVDGMSLYRGYFGVNGVDWTGEKLIIPWPRHETVILGMLNKLCPDGHFKVRADGTIYAETFGFCSNEIGIFENGCWIQRGPIYKCSSRPNSCECVCKAIISECNFSVIDGLSNPSDSILGVLDSRARRRAEKDKQQGGCGGYVQKADTGGCDKNIYIGDEVDRIPGFGDSNPPSEGTIRTPRWLILGHELCGHAVTGLSHPKDETRYTDEDPVIVVENVIRKEHSTACDDYGHRNRPKLTEAE
jgi:RHS repeat-associated protein